METACQFENFSPFLYIISLPGIYTYVKRRKFIKVPLQCLFIIFQYEIYEAIRLIHIILIIMILRKEFLQSKIALIYRTSIYGYWRGAKMNIISDFRSVQQLSFSLIVEWHLIGKGLKLNFSPFSTSSDGNYQSTNVWREKKN